MTTELKQNYLFTEQRGLKARIKFNFGGRGSGKSYGVTQNIILSAIESKKNVIVFRKIRAKVKKSILKLFVKIIEDHFGFILNVHYTKKVSSDDMQISFLFNGSVIDFDGLDDIEKTKGFEGYDIALIEEVSEFSREGFNAIAAIMRNKGAEIYATTNPIPKIPGTQHWMETDFINQVPKDFRVNHMFEVHQEIDGKDEYYNVCVLKTTYKHNDFCEKEFKIWIENIRVTNPDLYKMWGEGEFAEFKGAILNQGYEVIQNIPSNSNFVGYGLDYGFANDPAALIEIYKKERKYYLNELIYSTGLTDDELFSMMRKSGVELGDKIIADSSEPKATAMLKKLGFARIQGCGHKPKGYKRAAAMYLKGCEFYVTQSSVNLMTELSTWSWETDKGGDIKPGAYPADGNDHLIDALLYGDQLNKILPTNESQLMNVYM